MIVADANILLSAVLGTQTMRDLESAIERELTIGVPEPQLAEAMRVLVGKLDYRDDEAEAALSTITYLIKPLTADLYASHETPARQRLHTRGQPDWPVLAAALATEGGVWSHDRDFFGVGVPVWSSRNLRFAA